MSIKFFIQWYQWVNTGTWNWGEFDVVNISFERDRVAGDWGVTVILLGFGFYFHYVTRKAAEYWKDKINELESNND